MKKIDAKSKTEVSKDLIDTPIPVNPPEHLNLNKDMDSDKSGDLYRKLKEEIVLLKGEVEKCKVDNQELRDMMEMERSEKQIREEKVLSDHLKEVLELKKLLEKTSCVLKEERWKNIRLERIIAKQNRNSACQDRKTGGILSYLFGRANNNRGRTNDPNTTGSSNNDEPQKLSRMIKKPEAASIKKNKRKQERSRRRRQQQILEEKSRKAGGGGGGIPTSNRLISSSDHRGVEMEDNLLTNPYQLFLDVGPQLALRVREFDSWQTEELFTWLAFLDIPTIRNKIEVFEIYSAKDLVEHLSAHENDGNFYFNVPSQDQLKFFLNFELMKDMKKFSSGYLRVINKLVKILGHENILFHELLSIRRKPRIVEYSRML